MANVEYYAESTPVSQTLSLLSGIVIIMSSVIAWIFFYFGYNFGLSITIISPMIAAISGIVIFIAAIKMCKEPKQVRMCGIIVLIFSSVALVAISNFAVIGSALGIIGGILSVYRR